MEFGFDYDLPANNATGASETPNRLDLDVVRTTDSGLAGEAQSMAAANDAGPVVASADRRPPLQAPAEAIEPPVEQSIGAIEDPSEQPVEAAEGTEKRVTYEVSPERKMPMAAKEWEEALKRAYEAAGVTFEGDLAKGAMFAHAFGIGVRYVNDTYNARGADLTLPSVRLDVDPDVVAGYTTPSEAVVLGHPMLAIAAAQDSERVNLYKDMSDGTVVYDGSLWDHYVLLGVEEGHHYIYAAYREPEYTLGKDTSSLAEYDAINIEWHALRWQARAAREMGMSEKTLAVLERRLEAAKQLRRQARQQPSEG